MNRGDVFVARTVTRIADGEYGADTTTIILLLMNAIILGRISSLRVLYVVVYKFLMPRKKRKSKFN